VMLKLMRACIGVKDWKVLWFNRSGAEKDAGTAKFKKAFK